MSNFPPVRNTHRGSAEELHKVSGGLHLSAEGYRRSSGRLHRRRVGLYSGPHRSQGKTPKLSGVKTALKTHFS